MPLFDEARRVVHEDPRIRDTAAYSSVLAAVAAGESSPTKIGGLLGRPATSLTHQLTTLASAGFINRRHDLLLDRRPVVTVADPMVRFHQLVIEPYLADLEAGRARQVWAEAEHTVESKILGPHFEALAADGPPGTPPGKRASPSARSGRPSSPAASTRLAMRSTSWRSRAAAARGPPARRSCSSARPSTATAVQVWPSCVGFSTSATC